MHTQINKPDWGCPKKSEVEWIYLCIKPLDSPYYLWIKPKKFRDNSPNTSHHYVAQLTMATVTEAM